MSYRVGAVRFPQRQFSESWVAGRALRPGLSRYLSVSISLNDVLLCLCLVFLLGLQVLINSYISQMRGQSAVIETELSRSISKNALLQAEEKQLKTVSNIALSAQKMGLNPPQKHQIVRMTAELK
ncbi:MAG: hypothetical protein PHC35_08365 [Deltaproteobacteria bacterium]|jgi:hypothetical protein|nr:hypothetical protein [Deltaproteobacteria bacterium]